MAMLDGLRNIFMQSLRFCKNKISYDFLVEKWNEECEEVYKYKQALIAEEQAKHTPTADVVEVKHGEWKRVECGTICTKCNRVYDKDFEFSHEKIKTYFKRCPECGAKMDGVGNE